MTADPNFAAGAIPSSDDRTMSMLAHLGGIVAGFVPALVIYLIKGNDSEYVKEQGAEALNFQITVAIGYVVSFLLIFAVIGILLLPLVWIGSTVLAIVAGIAANKGEHYRYPVNIRLIK